MNQEARSPSPRRNLECMTKKDLISLAKQRVNPIKGMWKMTKSELVAAMRSKSSSSKSKKPAK